MSPQEERNTDTEVNTQKILTLTPNKLITRLPIMLNQIKDSYKLKKRNQTNTISFASK